MDLSHYDVATSKQLEKELAPWSWGNAAKKKAFITVDDMQNLPANLRIDDIRDSSHGPQ